VQVFDAEGEFITQWDVKGDDVYISGMDCTRDGTVCLAYEGAVWLHDGMSGEMENVLHWGDHSGFEDVCVAPDGSVIAAWNVFEDNIVRFDPSGAVDLVIPDAISGQTGDSELDMKVAVDGAGNMYALGTFNNAVVSYSPDGRFIDRFGSDEDVPGGFTAPHAIGTDATGRVLVSDFQGVMVFDSSGLYYGTIDVDGFVFDLDVDDDNRLYTVSGDCMVSVFDMDSFGQD
jgi:hypothetical protein